MQVKYYYFPIWRKINLKHTVYVIFPVLHSNEVLDPRHLEGYANIFKHYVTGSLLLTLGRTPLEGWQVDKNSLRNFIPPNNTLDWVTYKLYMTILLGSNDPTIHKPATEMYFFEYSF